MSILDFPVPPFVVVGQKTHKCAAWHEDDDLEPAQEVVARPVPRSPEAKAIRAEAVKLLVKPSGSVFGNDFAQSLNRARGYR